MGTNINDAPGDYEDDNDDDDDDEEKIRMGWSVIVAGVDCDLDEIPSEQRGLEFYHYADV